MTEQLVAEADRIYCWGGPKMKATLFSAKLGRLVLTDQRLVFLSTGKSDAAKLAAKAALASPIAATRGHSTAALDEDALHNEGSLSIPVGDIKSCEVGKKRALVVTYRDESGIDRAHTFGEKLGMPARDDWVDRINAMRARAADTY